MLVSVGTDRSRASGFESPRKGPTGLFLITILLVIPTVGLAQTKLELDCLGLAASSLQTDLPDGIKGQSYDAFDANAALPVCEAAMAEAGQNASTRLVYAMGRTYQKLERHVEAFSTYKSKEGENYGPILQNLGAMYDMGSGLQVNNELAFSYFQRAGQAGLAMGWISALAVLDKPDAPASLKPNLPEVLRQVIFSTEDAAAPERLAAAIKAGEIAPAFPEERQQLLEIAMNRGNLNGVVELLQILADAGELDLAYQIADKALKTAQSATVEQDAGWPVYQPTIAANVIKIAKANPTHAALSKLASELDARYGERMLKSTPDGSTCNDVATPITIFFWDETPPNPRQIDDQIAYFKARGCMIAENFATTFNAVLAKSIAGGTSLTDEVDAALKAGEETTQEPPQTAEAPAEPDTEPPAEETTNAAAPRKASEVYTVFERGEDGTYWVNPAPDQTAATADVVKVTAALECSGKKLEGVFSVFRNPNQRTVPNFKARVVATLVQGSDCDLEQNTGAELEEVDRLVTISSDYSENIFVSGILKRDVIDSYQSGEIPDIRPIWDECKAMLLEEARDFDSSQRESLNADVRIQDDYLFGPLFDGTISRYRSSEKTIEWAVRTQAENLRNWASVIADCASGRLGDAVRSERQAELKTLKPEDPNAYLASGISLAHRRFFIEMLDEQEIFVFATLADVSRGPDSSIGREIYSDWGAEGFGTHFFALTGTKREAGNLMIGLECDIMRRTKVRYGIVALGGKPPVAAVRIRFDELEVATTSWNLPDFGEVFRFSYFETSEDVDFSELMSNASGLIKVTLSDGEEVTFSSRGSAAAIKRTLDRCSAALKAVTER